ncbi:MAG: DNA polymerase III subunit gamma/tau [Candidatus Dependentiae bacterium]
MSSTKAHLNLARKWRSQKFDQIIGQDLSVRMLKNSLYLHHFFPVYLFSGQRGCGKTTTARVFASAINCAEFEAFQKEPKKHMIPCLQCVSCTSMIAGKHPDFIEMDAASHTGVDNVRQIIDASSLMPLMGRKKIYLIDEAHMLSKAAFNAFLKILEEPPASVLFILATTDPEKIIETVRSRCFQLFFKPIDAPVLLTHLMHVCDKENIGYEVAGLDLIIKETEGSARDALNMLESVRFSAGNITKKAVLRVLGHVEDERIIALLQAVVHGDSILLLHTLQKIDSSGNTALYLWRSFLQLLRASIWIKHGVEPNLFVQHVDTIKKIIHTIGWKKLHAYLDFCYKNEQLFLKTTNQYAFFEMILLQLCSLRRSNDNDPGSGCSSTPSPLSVPMQECSEDDQEDDQEEEDIIDEETANFSQKWQLSLREIESLDDPLVISIFKQSVFKQFDEKLNLLEVEFCKKFVFFQDWLDNTKNKWMRVLQKRFGTQVIFKPHFTGKDVEPIKTAPIVLEQAPQRTASQSVQASYGNKGSYTKKRSYGQKSNRISHGPLLDISQKDQWPRTHMLLQHFPGTVHAYSEGIN